MKAIVFLLILSVSAIAQAPVPVVPVVPALPRPGQPEGRTTTAGIKANLYNFKPLQGPVHLDNSRTNNARTGSAYNSNALTGK
jgi:hypothetical protein